MNSEFDHPSNYPPTSAPQADPLELEQSQALQPDPIRITSIGADDEVFRLLEERLVVDRGKRKVGEVIVRKEVETRMVQVPVRRERLIVEQVSPELRQLAAIDLGQGEVLGVDIADIERANGLELNKTISTSSTDSSAVSGTFTSLEKAAQVLNDLAQKLKGQHDQVHVEIKLNDPMLRDGYQAWLDRQSS